MWLFGEPEVGPSGDILTTSIVQPPTSLYGPNEEMLRQPFTHPLRDYERVFALSLIGMSLLGGMVMATDAFITE